MHYSVMKNEVIEYLNLKNDGIYVDATLGYAGHASEILKRIKKGYLFAFDADSEAISYSQEVLRGIGTNFEIIHANFREMEKYLHDKMIDGFLFDLGLSSPEIDDVTRGFSFMSDSILDMRMDKTKKFSAKDVVNSYNEEALRNIFYQYGEEKESAKIARGIVKYRENKEITGTLELVEIIKNSVGANYFFKTHPERVIFQAIRIEVNDELKAIEEVLPIAIKHLKVGGRICVITFHSLEDRIVKKIFKKYSEVNNVFKGLPNREIPLEYRSLIKLINKKPITPSEEEIKINSRSRSAKLRIVERI